MTERVAGDCSSGLLETTSNRVWSAAKANTHQLLQHTKKGGGEERERREGAQGLKRRFSSKTGPNVAGSNGCSRPRDRQNKHGGKAAFLSFHPSLPLFLDRFFSCCSLNAPGKRWHTTCRSGPRAAITQLKLIVQNSRKKRGKNKRVHWSNW